MSRRAGLLFRRLSFSFSMVLTAFLVGCGGSVVTETGESLNGTCVNCHRGISDAHPNGAAIGCVNCHGGDASDLPFRRAGEDVFALLADLDENVADPNGGRFIPVNPTELADQGANPFPNGRVDQAFQVLMASAHIIPKGCAGPREIEAQPLGALDPDGGEDLDGDGAAEDRVHTDKLTPGQLNNLVAAAGAVNDDCHAVFFWPNGIDDDGDNKVDELGEFSMFNPTDPIGLQYEFDKIDVDGNGVIDAAEAVNIGLDKSKTINVDLNGNGVIDAGEQVPVKLGQTLDSEFNIDLNYVRFLNPGDVRSAAASCGANSPASTFLGGCHFNEVNIVRRSIMSYMSGVLAGAIYANGSIPNSRALTNQDGNTDRVVQDLREGRIGYLQNYDSIDQAFDTNLNRFVTVSVDGVNEQNGEITDLGDIFARSKQNQLDQDAIFGVDDLLNGLDQDDCDDGLVDDANTFTGNLCLESYPEAIFRNDDIALATALAREGVDAATAARITTQAGTFTAQHGGDVFANRRPSTRLVFGGNQLQDPGRSLFVLAPIPRRTIVALQNQALVDNLDAVSQIVTGQGILAAIELPAAPEDAVVGGILDDRAFDVQVGINPVDTALQTFRPFHSLSFPPITGDFFFFDEFQLIDGNANNDVFILRNNPHGRGRGSGCTSCHMPYDVDGVNRETDPTVRLNGKQPGDVVLGRSPLVNSGLGLRTSSIIADFNENAAAQALATIEINEAAKWEQVRDLVADALGVDAGELGRLQFPTGKDDFGRERFYPSQHKLTTNITSQGCEVCHAFVTRVGFAAVGRHENEGGMEFINWYTWTPRDFNNDQQITHAINDANNNGLAAGDNEADLGQFITNRPAAPGQDFLEFRNAVEPNQKVRIFNNLPAFVGGANPQLLNTGLKFTEDLNNNGILEAGENVNDVGDGIALDLPDRPGRDRIFDGRQQRAVYGGPSGAVLLQDIHLEKGMHCGDCHFLIDSHGDGNLYARNWDAISIKCIDCHGTSKKLGTLVSSGPNGGDDLTKSKDQFGVPFFEIGNDGERIQRSRAIPGRQFRIPQVLDAIDPKSPEFSPEAAEAMAVLQLNPVDVNDDNAHIAESQEVNGVFRVGAGRLECSSCHNSWTPNCMTCHMDFDYAQTVGEIWATQEQNPISFFQLFTIIRSPFLLAQSGSNDRNRIMPQRSLMELHPNVTLNNGDALAENLTFSTPRGVSGVAMNQYMPHTVRLKETKDCESCHALSADDLAALKDKVGNDSSPFDGILNNNILSQTLGLGSGRLGEPGDFMFGASAVGLEGIDTKAEAKRALDDDGDGLFQVAAVPNQNTFQGFRGQGFGSGFLVASADDTAIVNTGLNINRSFSNAIAGANDVVFVRNFIDPTELDPATGMFIGAVRALDLAVVSDGAQITTRLVTDRTGALSVNARGTVALAGVQAIDHLQPDMSDPFVVAVTNNGDIAIIDLRTLDLGRLGANDGNAIAAQNTVGTNLVDVELDGNFAFVLDDEGNAASLRIIHARSTKYFDREVDADGSQVAVDFLFAEPGTLDEVGVANLQGCTEPRKVAIMNIMAYVACGQDGLFVVNIEDPLQPHVIGSSQDAADFNAQNPGNATLVAGGLDDAQGVYASDNRLFVANGNAQNAANAAVVVFDVTEPFNPRPVRRIKKQVGLAMVDPVDIIGFVEPGQFWILVSDSVGRAHAVNISEAYNIRVRLGEHAAAARGVLGGQDDEAEGSVPGFRPEEDLAIFASQGLAAERPFFEDTNVRFTLDLRDWMTPNDPAQIDEIIQNAIDPNSPLHIISFNLAGGGDVRLAQTSELDRMADFSGFAVRDSWASSIAINVGCDTPATGVLVDTDCESDEINALGALGARPLSGPHIEDDDTNTIVRGLMDVMRGVFVKEIGAFDLTGNGMGNMVCIGVVVRDDNGSVQDVADCNALYPADVAEALGLVQQ